MLNTATDDNLNIIYFFYFICAINLLHISSLVIHLSPHFSHH